MSGASVANKVNKAMIKVGSKLGFPCTVYRPDGYMNPLQDKNIVFENLSVAFSVDEAFVRNPVDELDHYKIYIFNKGQEGDILIFEDGRTLILTEMEPIRAPAGILANDRMSMFRSQSTPTLDVKISLVLINENVPCAVKIKPTSTVSVQFTTMKSGQSNLEIWTWMPVNDILISDVIEIDGSRFIVTSVNSAVKGTKITANSTILGK